MNRTYLDYNATAPLRPEAREAMIAAMEVVGNPSSVHAEGRAAKALVEKARAQVAEAVGCKPVEVVFTSGATEAAGFLGDVATGASVVVEPTAHDALWAHHAPRAGERAAIYAMGLANSETGVISTPPKRGGEGFEVGELRADRLLLDVTQAVGRLPWSFAWSGADFALLSAHKLGGPKGVGALIVKDGTDIPALSKGGGQEMGRRSGTENIIGIAGFGAAAAAAQADLEQGRWDEVAELRNILESAIEAAANKTILVGNRAERLPNTTCAITPGWKGETQVMTMDLAGFSVSSGSACSSGKVKASRVLQAMGFGPDEAQSAIRVSLGPRTTEAEVRRFADVWLEKQTRHAARAA